MKPPLSTLLFFWAAALLCAPPASGNQIRLQFLSLDEGEVTDLFRAEEADMQPLRIPASFLPAPISTSRETPFFLYRKMEAPEEGASPWQPVARLNFPEGASDAVVLVQSNGERVSASVIPLNDRQFPAGAYMLFNRTPRAILIGVDEEVTRIPPQSVRIVQPAVQQRKPIPVFFRAEGDEENRSLVTTTWFHNPANREFVFLSSPGIEIRVRSVSRHPPPE